MKNGGFCVLVKAQITRKTINLPGRTIVRNSLQYFIWLKSKTANVYAIVKSVKIDLKTYLLMRW